MGNNGISVQRLVISISASLLMHLLVMYGIVGKITLGPPVMAVSAIMIDVVNPVAEPETPALTAETKEPAADSENPPPVARKAQSIEQPPELSPLTPAPVSQAPPHEPMSVPPVIPTAAQPVTPLLPPESQPAPALQHPVSTLLTPVRSSHEFLAASSEKLTYRITLLGVPVGEAELEARQEKGELTLALRVDSNPLISTLYPVHNLIETRHIHGNFIITKIAQHEGSFTNDIGFTLFLRDKQAFWLNRLTNKSSRETLPTSEALDTLSGIYLLRNRPLQVGVTEILHIYDSETYAEVPVEIEKIEKIRLADLREVETVVVRPLQKTAGIFRRTGDIRIWFTNDANKVPVRIVTTISLGTVTAELVSAKSTPRNQRATEK